MNKWGVSIGSFISLIMIAIQDVISDVEKINDMRITVMFWGFVFVLIFGMIAPFFGGKSEDVEREQKPSEPRIAGRDSNGRLTFK